jgi:surface antigen
MRAIGAGTKAWLLGSAILFACPLAIDTLAVNSAQAAQDKTRAKVAPHPVPTVTHAHSRSTAPVSHAVHLAAGKRGATRSYGISCVPYARQVSGIEVTGNAWQWWENAAGEYARGDRPEIGSVLNFRSNGRMRLGHVAVVTKIVNAREVIVDHANWQSAGRISHDIAVVDVSEANNWSAVRVELGREGTFGSVYPTYGFIYSRPDTGAVMASIRRPAPQADINPIPSDLRPVAERPWQIREEVAESPMPVRQKIEAAASR